MTGIDDLFQVLRAVHDVVHWKFLGLELGIPYNELAIVDKMNSRPVLDCKLDMIRFWLERRDKVIMGVPSWSFLKEALRNIGENELADTIPTDGEFV